MSKEVYLLQSLNRLWVVVWLQKPGPGDHDYNPDFVLGQDTSLVKITFFFKGILYSLSIKLGN